MHSVGRWDPQSSRDGESRIGGSSHKRCKVGEPFDSQGLHLGVASEPWATASPHCLGRL